MVKISHRFKKVEPIETIRRRFRRKREWLLIAVKTIDDRTTTPLTGKLLAHSPHQDDILKKSMYSKKTDLLIDYSEDSPPKGTVLIF